MAGRTLPPAPPPGVVHEPDHPVWGFFASSRKLDSTKSKGPESLGPQGPKDDEAWRAYDEVSEVGTLVDDPAALLSQCRLYAGWQDADLRDHRLRDEDGNPVEGFPEQFVADCEMTMARVSDPGGSQRGLIFAQAQNMSVTGDAYMVGWSIDKDGAPVEETDPSAVGERWEVVSRGALDRKRNQWTIQLSGMKATVLPASAVVYRMWNRHPRRPDDPRSWLIRNLDVVRDLRVFTLAARSAGRSSIPGSIWVVPEEASPKMVVGQTAGGPGVVPPGAAPGTPAVPGFPPGFPGTNPAPAPGSPPLDPTQVMSWGRQLEYLLGQAIMEAVGDSNSGRAIVPSVLTVTKEYVDAFHQIDLHRPIDSALQGFIELSMKRLARAASAPPEMLEGLGETNRWNGAQIADDEFRRYFKPGADAIADSWTVEILWGGLRALGHPEDLIRRVRVLVDPRGVVAEPDESALALDIFDRGGLSYAALRRRCKISEDDAPTPEEQAFIAEMFGRRMSSRKATQGGEVNTKAGSAGPLAAGADDDHEDDHEAPVQAADLPGPVPVEQRRAPLGQLRARTAASIETTPTGEQLAEQLALIDQSARDRLEEAAEMALDAALSRAGAKLRTWARKDQDLRALLAPVVDQRAVLTTLGPDRARQVAAAQFATDDERRDDLFAAALVALLASFDRITRGALTQALRLLAVAVVETGEDPPAWARASVPAETLQAASLQGAEVLRSSMMMLADARVFEPATLTPVGGRGPAGTESVTGSEGETSSLQVPPTVIAAALAAAGGTPVMASLLPQREAAQGLVWGPMLRGFLPEVLAWRWDYGTLAERRSPWPPHADADGRVFTGLDDPALAGLAPGGGPGFPGDHSGCRCRYVAVLADPTW